MSYVFIRLGKDGSNELKINSDDITWSNLSEEFFRFLQGSGYQLTRRDLAAYWAESAGGYFVIF